MAANKPFANFDKLSKLARPSVLAPSNTPSQGGQKINPGFAKQISLADRLKQTDLGTTKHLAQFFVTDVFTNVIKIKKPIEIPKDSLVTIGLPTETKQQGGEAPRTILFTPIHGETDPRAVRYDLAEKQGVIKFPDAFDVSNITIVYPSNQTDKSLTQGTYYLNGQYYSVTQTETPPVTLEQGTVEIKKIITVKQQGGTDPEKPISVGEVEIAQGIVTINGKASSQTSTMIPVPQVLQGGVNPTLSLPPSIIATSQYNEGGANPVQSAVANAFIDEQNINLRTVGYTSLGFGLRFAPVIVQGGQSPINQSNVENIGFRVQHLRSATISALLNPPDTTSVTYKQADLVNNIPAGITGGELDGYNNVGKKSLHFQTVQTYPSRERTKRAIEILNPVQGIGGDQAAALIGLVMLDPSNGRASDASVDDYEKHFKSANQSPNNTVTSVEVGGIENQPNPNIPITDALGSEEPDPSAGIIGIIKEKVDFKQHRKGFNGSYKFYGDTNNYEQIIQAVNRSPRADAKRPGASIKIEEIKGGANVSFPAFIKTLGDSVTAAYGDYKHIGQMDTFKIYQGATRQISLGFDAVALGKGNEDIGDTITAKELQEKIDLLMRICTVGGAEGSYIVGPIIKISIANYAQGLICACGSVKADVPIADTAWDQQAGLPHIYNVTMDLTVLTMKGGILLKRDGAFY